ncbi:MAG TPA: acyl carrier protein [Pseudonocardiaceae bacterium]|jgi:acyl carrier protein|nr:acyl carrier protein [Pseudonocardiaceae bacterium]
MPTSAKIHIVELVTSTDTDDAKRYHDVLAAIGEILREVLHQPELTISDAALLRDELGLDSADIAELIVELEARTLIPLPDELLEPTDAGDPLASVGSLARTVSGQHVDR